MKKSKELAAYEVRCNGKTVISMNTTGQKHTNALQADVLRSTVERNGFDADKTIIKPLFNN
jgi:hypothetical protein